MELSESQKNRILLEIAHDRIRLAAASEKYNNTLLCTEMSKNDSDAEEWAEYAREDEEKVYKIMNHISYLQNMLEGEAGNV